MHSHYTLLHFTLHDHQIHLGSLFLLVRDALKLVFLVKRGETIWFLYLVHDLKLPLGHPKEGLYNSAEQKKTM